MPWKIKWETEILDLEGWSRWVVSRPCLHSDRWVLSSQSILPVINEGFTYCLGQETTLSHPLQKSSKRSEGICHVPAAWLLRSCDSEQNTWPSRTSPPQKSTQKPMIGGENNDSFNQHVKLGTQKKGRGCQHQENSSLCGFFLLVFTYFNPCHYVH